MAAGGTRRCSRCAVVLTVITRCICHLDTNPRLHGNWIKGVSGSEGSRPRVDVHGVVLCGSRNTVPNPTELPGQLSGRIQCASCNALPAVNAGTHSAPRLIRSLRGVPKGTSRNTTGSIQRPDCTRILEQEVVRLDRPA